MTVLYTRYVQKFFLTLSVLQISKSKRDMHFCHVVHACNFSHGGLNMCCGQMGSDVHAKSIYVAETTEAIKHERITKLFQSLLML